MKRIALLAVFLVSLSTSVSAMDPVPEFEDVKEIGEEARTVLNNFVDASQVRLGELNALMKKPLASVEEIKAKQAEWKGIYNAQVEAWNAVKKAAAKAYGGGTSKRLPEPYYEDWLTPGMTQWKWIANDGAEVFYSVKRAQTNHLFNVELHEPMLALSWNTFVNQVAALDEAITNARKDGSSSNLEKVAEQYTQVGIIASTHETQAVDYNNFIKKQDPAKKTKEKETLKKWEVDEDTVFAACKEAWTRDLNLAYGTWIASHELTVAAMQAIIDGGFLADAAEGVVKDWKIKTLTTQFKAECKSLGVKLPD